MFGHLIVRDMYNMCAYTYFYTPAGERVKFVNIQNTQTGLTKISPVCVCTRGNVSVFVCPDYHKITLSS